MEAPVLAQETAENAVQQTVISVSAEKIDHTFKSDSIGTHVLGARVSYMLA